MNATVTNIKSTTTEAAATLNEKVKAACARQDVRDAAKFAGAVVGGAAVLGVGYAVFAKTANTVYGWMS